MVVFTAPDADSAASAAQSNYHRDSDDAFPCPVDSRARPYVALLDRNEIPAGVVVRIFPNPSYGLSRRGIVMILW